MYQTLLIALGKATYKYAGNMTDENYQAMLNAQNEFYAWCKEDNENSAYREYQAEQDGPEFPSSEFPFK